MDPKVISTGIRYPSLPESYVLPESERPKLSEVEDYYTVPQIDLGLTDRDLLVRKIGEAGRQYGFFQVVNHGVSVDEMLRVVHEFFGLSVEEKMKLYSDGPSKTMRDSVSSYRERVRALGFRLQELIAESLGLPDHKKNVLKGQHMAVNFYPPCPELTYGLPGHTDPNALTILLQDLQVTGIQVLKDGKWMAVKPDPNAFVIIPGDQLQALSNGKYKSVQHQAIVNADMPRRAVAPFLYSIFIKGKMEEAPEAEGFSSSSTINANVASHPLTDDTEFDVEAQYPTAERLQTSDLGLAQIFRLPLDGLAAIGTRETTKLSLHFSFQMTAGGLVAYHIYLNSGSSSGDQGSSSATQLSKPLFYSIAATDTVGFLASAVGIAIRNRQLRAGSILGGIGAVLVASSFFLVMISFIPKI